MLKQRTPMKRSAPLRRETGKATLTVRLPDVKDCAICAKPFKPARPLQSVCGQRCVLRQVREKEAAVKALDRQRREAIKTRADWIAEVQVAFNAFIRLRDAGKPCICCGKPFETDRPGGSVDAGHYLSRGGSPHLRFDERNVHAQRKSCNRPGGTTRDAFRAGMVSRIGLEALLALEADQHPRKWTVDDLKAMKAHYLAKARELRKREA